MHGVSDCPDAQTLQRFLLGQNSREEATLLEEHLQGCDSCFATLQTLHGEDSMVDALRARSDTAEVTANKGVQLLAEWLKKLRPAGHAMPTSSVGNPPGTRDTEVFAKSAEADGTVSFEFLTPSQGPTELGRLGQYHVRKVLGAGGMGVVFEAYDPDLDRLVALKTMLPAQAAIAGAKKRFLREAKAAAAIKHDHIVTIYQVGEDRDIAFLAMEYLEGESLDQRLQRERKLPLPDVLRIARECAEALAAAHAKGLIHRDIKPGNIWLESPRTASGEKQATPNHSPLAAHLSLGRAKLLDFGLALPTADNTHLTQSGAIVGTPAFMAPEQLRGQVVDARADLFSLGCVMYRMATGQAAFKGTHAVSTLIAVATTNPRPPQELNPKLPLSLCDLIMLLLAKSPDDRPATALAVVESIRAVEQGSNQPVTARRSPDPTVEMRPTGLQATEPPAALRRRTYRPVGLAFAAAVLTVVAGLAGYWYWPTIDGKGSNKVGSGMETVDSEKNGASRTAIDVPVKEVSGDGKNSRQVYADKAHALEDVLDFRDLIGASAAEFGDWRAKLEPDFRVSHVTSRRGDGPTLFNAVAVREKTPRVVHFVPELTTETHQADWDRNCLDEFRLLHNCTFARPGQKPDWGVARLWVKDGVLNSSWYGSDLDELKNRIVESSAANFRPVYLEYRPTAEAPLFQMIERSDQGRKADPIYTLNHDALSRAVESLQFRKWRPDLVVPIWEDNRLRFMLVGVENADGPDWRFQMDMTAKAYRVESDKQRQRGWFPIAVASHGNDPDVRYVAIWVRGRVLGSLPPPTEPWDAKTLADRAAKAVSWANAGAKEVYIDGAHALGEIIDFRELVGGTSHELRDWQEKLDPKFRITSVTSRDGAGETRFNAVAVEEKLPHPWRVHIQMNAAMAAQVWKQNHDDGYRVLANCSSLSPGEKLPWHATQVWVKDGIGTRVWFGLLRDVVSWNRDKKETSDDLRPIWMEARMSPDGLGGNTAHAPHQGRAWEAFYSLTSNELLATLEFYRRKGWRPDVVYPYLDGGRLLNQLTVVDNAEKVDWRFRMDMSRADYETESAQQKRQGLFPLGITSYGNEDAIRYAAIFVRYRK